MQAAKLGNVDALALCGNMLYFGRGVKQDQRRGRRFMKKAAIDGSKITRGFDHLIS